MGELVPALLPCGARRLGRGSDGGNIVRPNLEKDLLFKWVERQAKAAVVWKARPTSAPFPIILWPGSTASKRGGGQPKKLWKNSNGRGGTSAR